MNKLCKEKLSFYQIYTFSGPENNPTIISRSTSQHLCLINFSFNGIHENESMDSNRFYINQCGFEIFKRIRQVQIWLAQLRLSIDLLRKKSGQLNIITD